MTSVADRAPPPLAPRPPATPFSATGEILILADAFERCELPRAAWTHAAHRTVALCTSVLRPRRVASGYAAASSVNAANGVPQTPDGATTRRSALHLWAVGRHLRDARANASIATLRPLHAAWATKPPSVLSRERLMSWEARTGWVEPDLKAME